MSHAASPPETLPSRWVEQIFGRLSIRYGRAFLARWDGLDIADVKADWAEQLGGFVRRPDCIGYALANLPADRPPTVGEFRALCNAMPEPARVALPAPPRGPIPKAVASQLAGIAAQPYDPKAWARRLKGREEAGDVLPEFSRRAWREALRVSDETPA